MRKSWSIRTSSSRNRRARAHGGSSRSCVPGLWSQSSAAWGSADSRVRNVAIGAIAPSRDQRCLSAAEVSAFRMSIGTGKMVVLLFSVAISASVWR